MSSGAKEVLIKITDPSNFDIHYGCVQAVGWYV
jgi:hypothetical protein